MNEPVVEFIPADLTIIYTFADDEIMESKSLRNTTESAIYKCYIELISNMDAVTVVLNESKFIENTVRKCSIILKLLLYFALYR